MIELRTAFRKPMGLKLLTAAGILISAAGVQAEPYIAMRTGFKCSQCHVNKIGGGERTEYGEVYSQYQLLMTQTQDLMQAEGVQSSFNPKINDMITVGGNFRMEEFVTRKYTYTDNVGAHVSPSANEAQISEANFYMNVELIKNYLNLYMDEGLEGPSRGGAREMFGMVRNLPLDSYIKAGKMLLPYGLRLVDDNAFIRAKTGYTYNTTGLAAEIGLEPGPLSLTANVTDNQFSGVGSVVFRHFRIGGSYGGSWQNGTTPVNGVHYTYGPFGGFNFGRLTAMQEVDFIKGINSGNLFVPQIADLSELDFLALQGVNVKATYEYYDRDTRVAMSKNGQDRWTFGVEPFISRFLQVGLYYRINRAVPQDTVSNQDQIIGRIQVFF
jgi:hypothetical protein